MGSPEQQGAITSETLACIYSGMASISKLLFWLPYDMLKKSLVHSVVHLLTQCPLLLEEQPARITHFRDIEELAAC